MIRYKTDSFEAVLLRTRRAKSWIDPANSEMAKQQYHTAFVMYWIAFNACYEDYLINEMKPREERISEKKQYQGYLRRIVGHDLERTITGICIRLGNDIYSLVENEFSYELFWKFGHRPESQGNNWKKQFDNQCRRLCTELKNKSTMDTKEILYIIFDRIYCVRNQIIHGSTTKGDNSTGISQTKSSATIMNELIPTFVRLMENTPYEADTWSLPSYPGEPLQRQPDGRYVLENRRRWRYDGQPHGSHASEWDRRLP